MWVPTGEERLATARLAARRTSARLKGDGRALTRTSRASKTQQGVRRILCLGTVRPTSGTGCAASQAGGPSRFLASGTGPASGGRRRQAAFRATRPQKRQAGTAGLARQGGGQG